MKNEKILIFGDSYSTYEGYIPEGFAYYYPREGEVRDASKTWWHMLASETGSEILQNNSWSGSTVCNMGYKGDCSKTSSFIHRLDVLLENGFFEKNHVDRVFVFGGTNDSWSGNTCGEPMYSGWREKDLLIVLPGFSYFIHKLMRVMPKEKIHVIINTDLRPEVERGILDICTEYGVSYTKLSDIEKVAGHPTCTGMLSIKDQVLSSLQ